MMTTLTNKRYLRRIARVQLLVMACLIVALVSCNKDEVTPEDTNKPLLTRISRGGVTDMELFYDIDRNLYRLDYYFGGTLSSYTIYDYNEMGLRESRRYNADDHALDYLRHITLDNFGRIIKSENYNPPDLSKVASVTEFGYNTSGQLITDEFRIPGQPVYALEEFGYDDADNLVTRIYTLYPGQPGEYMNAHYDFIPGSRPIPDHWEEYIHILGLSGLDERVRDMFYSGSMGKAWNADQEQTSEWSIEASGHVFDSDGNLTRLVLTRKNIMNPGNPDVVWEMTYEYAGN